MFDQTQKQLMRRLIPSWLSEYRREDLRHDLSAGLTVGVLLIPQAMAYAMLGGLPPVVGLYASLLPLLMYALVGTSRQLSVGPTAMDSLLLLAGASAVAPIGSPEFILVATFLAGAVGVIQFAMGMLKLGFIVNFMSRPVIGGFTTAAAVLIFGSQLGAFLGVTSPRAATLDRLVVGLLPGLGQVHWTTAAISTVSLGALIGLKRWFPRLPGSLIVVTIATLVTYLLRLDELGVRVVGHVPDSLPHIGVPLLSLDTVVKLAPSAVMLALIGMLEGISVAQAMAEKRKQTINSNREMMALGLANMGSYISGGFPVTGGFSRSAVADEAGARTQLTGVLAALAAAATLVWLTPLFYYVPQGALAALVMTGSISLMGSKEPVQLWNVRRTDAVMWGLTLLVTLFVGIGPGIVVGVVGSLIAFIRRSTTPHTAELGRLPGTSVFRNTKNYPNAELVPNVLILRMDASLYFANVSYFVSQVERFIQRAQRPIKAVLIDASGMNDLDFTAAMALHELTDALRAKGRALYFANVKRPVAEVMERANFASYLGADHFYLDVATGIRSLDTCGQKA